MSPRRQPNLLYQQCVDYFSGILDNLCNLHENELNNAQIVNIINYMHQFLPPTIKADIGTNILTHIDQCQRVLSPLQVKLMLSLQVRYLTLSGSSVRSGVLLDATATNLLKLTLLYRGCRDTATMVYGFLSTANHLTHLTCTDFCNDEMLNVIAQSCPNLTYLNLHACNEVTDDGILRLCGIKDSMRNAIDTLAVGGALISTSRIASTLKELKLKMTKVTEAGVAVILLRLTNICYLRVPDIPMKEVFNFLEKLEHRNTKSSLIEFRCREILDEHQLSVLTLLCPNLEYIQMTFVGNYETDFPRLQKLMQLQRLQALKLADIDVEAVLAFLNVVGERILYLNIYTYHTKFSQTQVLFIRPSHLLNIGKHCPNLESFHLKGYDLQEDLIRAPYSTDLTFPPYQNLHTLKLEAMKLSEDDLKVFLLNCRNMRILDLVLKDPHVLHDKLLSDLLDKGLWDNLMKVRILNSPITSKMMVRIVNECPNLKELGCLTTWLIAKQQVFDFKEKVRHENLDIDIYA